MSKREIAAAAAKKYILSLDNATANPPADRFHSVITLITLGKAEEAENINREKFLQAILTEFFLEYPILVVPEAITDPQSVVVTVLDNVILTKLVCYHNSVPNIYAPYSEFRLNFDRKGDTNTAATIIRSEAMYDDADSSSSSPVAVVAAQRQRPQHSDSGQWPRSTATATAAAAMQ